MPRIRGFFEYDDDDLTPGKKKEGGLHQNLYDGDGKLKGTARFIPDEKRVDKPGRAKKKAGGLARPSETRKQVAVPGAGTSSELSQTQK